MFEAGKSYAGQTEKVNLRPYLNIGCDIRICSIFLEKVFDFYCIITPQISSSSQKSYKCIMDCAVA